MDRRKLLLVVAVVVAALGAGLVFIYAQGAEDRARDNIATTRVLVAVAEVQPGESAADAADKDKLLLKDVPNDQLLEGHVDQGDALADTVALTTIYPGEQLTTNKFGRIEDLEGATTLPIPEGKTAITLQMTNATRVTSFTEPGSHVAIYYVPPTGTEGSADTGPVDPQFQAVGLQPACAIEADVLVLGVGSTSVDDAPPAEGEGDGQTGQDIVETTYLTIAVDSQQAARLVPFQQAQERNPNEAILSFALRNDTSDVQNTVGCEQFMTAFDKQLTLSKRAAGNG